MSCVERLDAPLLKVGRQAAAALAQSFGLVLGEARGYRHDLISARTAHAGDPDVDVAECCAGRTGLGIDAPIQARGVFPTALPSEAALAPKQHNEINLARGWAQENYASFEEHRDAAMAEVRRLVQVGFLEGLGRSWLAVTERWPKAGCTRFACLVKTAGETTKGASWTRGAPASTGLPRPRGGWCCRGPGMSCATRLCSRAPPRRASKRSRQTSGVPSSHWASAAMSGGTASSPMARGISHTQEFPLICGQPSSFGAVSQRGSRVSPRPCASMPIHRRPHRHQCRRGSRPHASLRARSRRLGRGTRPSQDPGLPRTRMVRGLLRLGLGGRLSVLLTQERLRRAHGLVPGVQQLAGVLSWMATVVVRLKPFVRPLRA